MSLSVVINTKNAAETIQSTLKSAQFADEIIIVDMNSKDQTVKICQQYTDKIFKYRDVGYVEPARNFAISKAQYNWVLIVDADEIVPEKLATYLQKVIEKNSEIAAYYLARKNIIWDKWIKHTNWWPDYQLRLFQKDKVKFSKKIHHPPNIKGETEHFPAEKDLALIHYNYQNIADYLERLQRYTNHEVNNLDIDKFSSKQALSTFFSEFFSRYFFAQGYKDGLRGTSLSLGQGCYQLFAYLKKWEEQSYREENNSEEELIQFWTNFQSELSYYIAAWQAQKSTGLKKVWWQIRKKFKI